MDSAPDPTPSPQRARPNSKPYEYIALPTVVSSIGRGCLLLTILGLPWMMGGVYVQYQAIAAVLLGVSVLCWIVLISLGHREKAGLSNTQICLLAFGGLVLAQLLPLPDALHWLQPSGRLSRTQYYDGNPEYAEKTRALEDTPDAITDSISIYPAGTRREFSLLVMALTAFSLGGRFFASSNMQIALGWALAVNGAAIAIFGIAQKLSWNGKLFWSIPLLDSNPFGPFVNRNNGGGYLCLSLAGGLAVLLHLFADNFSFGKTKKPARNETALEPVKTWFTDLEGIKIAALFLVACMIAGVLISGSRSAALGLAAGFVTMGVACWRIAQLRTTLLTLLATIVLAVGLIEYGGQSSVVSERLGSLTGLSAYLPRWSHWRESIRSIPDVLPTGAGLGAYRYSYAPYAESLQRATYVYAENQYLQLLAETGLLGSACLVLAGGTLLYAIIVLIRQSTGVNLCFALGGLFAVAAQGTMALADFGLSIPSNLLLFATLAGAIASNATHWVTNSKPNRWVTLWSRDLLYPSPLLASGLLVAIIWAGRELYLLSLLDSANRAVPALITGKTELIPSLEKSRNRFMKALRRRWDDAEMHARLAEIEIFIYRLKVHALLTAEIKNEIDKLSVWDATDVVALQQQAKVVAGNPLALGEIRNNRIVLDHLGEALRHYVLARFFCPYLPDAHLRLGELSFLIDDPASDIKHSRLAAQLAPGNPKALARTTLLEFQAGNIEPACLQWKRLITAHAIDPAKILPVVLTKLSFQEVIDKLLPSDAEYLTNLAARLFRHSEQQQEPLALLVRRARELLDASPDAGPPTKYLRSRLALLAGESANALTLLKGAVEARPNEAQWRYELALLCENAGERDEAVVHAQWCARLYPSRPDYQALLDRLRKARN